jgi:hypothetical protein
LLTYFNFFYNTNKVFKVNIRPDVRYPVGCPVSDLAEYLTGIQYHRPAIYPAKTVSGASNHYNNSITGLCQIIQRIKTRMQYRRKTI